ncbi:hypothetical protein ACFQU2_08440 [Siccirubricoccus deserti]
MTMVVRASGATDVGTVRKRNEDAFIDRSDIGLWAVADGAGGHGAGDVASAAVIAALAALPADLAPAEKLAEVRSRLAEVHAVLQQRAEDRRAASSPPPSSSCWRMVSISPAFGPAIPCLPAAGWRPLPHHPRPQPGAGAGGPGDAGRGGG